MVALQTRSSDVQIERKIMKQLTTLAVATLCLIGSVTAQTIERIKMTDNDLSCQQVFNEITQMDGIIARANQTAAASAAPAAQADNAAGGQAAGVAGAVAQQAIGQAAARSGFGGFGGAAGGLFGGLINQAAQQQQQAAQQQAAQQAAAQQAAAAQAQQNAALAQQAQGRKEHLTGVFLAKGCKMSEIQR